MTDRFVNIHTHRPTGRASNCGQPEFIRGMLTKKTLARSRRCSARCRPSAKRDSISYAAPTVRYSWRRSGRSSRWRANGGCRGSALRQGFRAGHARTGRLRPRAVIFHGFIGSPEQARRAVLKGYYLSFGLRAFASPKTLESLREIPLSQLFLETDDSDVPIEEIYARAAKVKGVTPEELQRATLENYGRIFTTGPQGQDKAAGTPPLPAR